MKDGEILPGIQLDEIKNRRKKLMQRIVNNNIIKNTSKEQILIMPSASKVYMSDKIPYVFRQNTDFLYFSGCQEPDSILVLTMLKDNFHSTLFVRKKDQHSELWDGPRTGVDSAANIFAMDQSLPISDFEQYVASFLKEHKNCSMWYDNAQILQPEADKILCRLINMNNVGTILSPKSIFHEIRSIKSKSEIALMKESCKIASKAIIETIKNSKPGIHENHLFAMVDYYCRMDGAEFLAYPPVVAAGKNATIIHYINNNQVVQREDMVLMDAGCEYHGYSSDITRTWPVSGTFSTQQKILYEIVLDVQKSLIPDLKEMPSLDQLYYRMLSLLGKRLQEIKLLPSDLNENTLMAAAYKYCPHHVGHYLGMDVHDTDKISRNVKVQPGMIVTVEPGIYIGPNNPYSPEQFHGLGIRIEDDVLITENGPIVLSKDCPKEISEIEQLASENQ
ncbi:xaa-Pro aminopeptidase 3 isoform X2 [Prorops nasuta]